MNSACVRCTQRKIKCSGERPICSRCSRTNKMCEYTVRKRMGRPRKVPLPSPTLSQTEVNTPSSSRLATLTNTECGSTESPLATQPELCSIHLTSAPASSSNGQLFDSDILWRSRNSINMPRQEEYTANSTDTDHYANTMQASCACISIIYLSLDEMRSTQSFAFPDSLSMLQKALQAGCQAIECPLCPLRFLSAMQNALLLGVLFMSVTECYAKLLQSLDYESSNKASNPVAPNVHFGPQDLRNNVGSENPSTYTLKLDWSDWSRLARKAIKHEIYGSPDSEAQQKSLSLIPLLQKLEVRQNYWHQIEPPSDAPEVFFNSCGGPQPTCLVLAKACQKLLNTLKLDEG